MKLVYKGKTKDVYSLENGNYMLKLKDDMTGKDGKFDPGENAVGLTVEGAGREGLKLSRYYFEKLNAAGFATHYVDSNIDEVTMTIRPATLFGKAGKGVEFICRFRAVGSFLRRYGDYCSEGDKLDAFVEITLKDDARLDPPITESALRMLGIMTETQVEEAINLTKQICTFIKDDLEAKGLELFDIKLEFGMVDGKVTLIDEISGGNMRVYKDGKIVDPMGLGNLILR